MLALVLVAGAAIVAVLEAGRVSWMAFKYLLDLWTRGSGGSPPTPSRKAGSERPVTRRARSEGVALDRSRSGGYEPPPALLAISPAPVMTAFGAGVELTIFTVLFTIASLVVVDWILRTMRGSK